jgi:hypothetical protein
MSLPFRFRLTLFAASSATLLAAFACLPVARAQISIGVTIGTPPPPLRYEVRPVYPGPGFLWQAGYWEPLNNRYRWQPGFWARQPYTDAYYVRPFYAHDPDGYRLHSGYWEHRGHGYGHGGFDHEGDYGYRVHDDAKHGYKDHHDHGKHEGRGHD